MPPGTRVVVATGNPHKVEEVREALAFTGWEFVAAADLGGWEEPEETGATFEENARIKARAARQRFGLPALADDSGLAVDALDGEPGVRSRYFAGPHATDAENNARLLAALGNTPRMRREARFTSVIVLLRDDGTEVVAEGVCEGRIGGETRGEGGFGYDPLFWPDATPGRTMAELSLAEKTAISHRGAALHALHDSLERE
ncbi:MAG TPA: RdgB/HAM1 family non-canonical purine NTP pyrophosphatase [Coriobacteriia bacterium]|nr:RdgB/HAM1 family non-canonical purine NTP pyrophosphatase [Coriobacteriia bacterium]